MFLSPSPRRRVSLSPRRRVSPSPRLPVSVSPCLRVCLSPRPRVSVSPRPSSLLLVLLFTWMIGGLEVCADLFERKPCWFKFPSRIKRSLVHEMATPGITARSKGVN
jgi:hypothetical protein